MRVHSCFRYGLLGWLGALSLVFASRAEAAKQTTRIFTVRAEIDRGSLYNTNQYSGTFEDESRTVTSRATKRTKAPAWGGRFAIGPQLDASKVTFFPHLFGVWAKTEPFRLDLDSQEPDYHLRVVNRYWSLGAALELQLLRRILLLDFGLAYSEGFARFAMPGVQAGSRRTKHLEGTLLHVGVGARLPVDPVSVGVRVLAEASVSTFQDPEWPLGSPVAYVAAAGFVEFDASFLIRGVR